MLVALPAEKVGAALSKRKNNSLDPGLGFNFYNCEPILLQCSYP